MRALVEDFGHGRQRSGVSRRHATRRAGAARMGNLAQGGGMSADEMAHAASDGTAGRFTRFGLAVAAVVCLLDQALKLWLIFGFDLGARGFVRLAPGVDLVLTWNTGI